MSLRGSALRILPAAVLLLFVSKSGLACTCELPSPGKTLKQTIAEARHRSKAVFLGTVVAIDKKPGELYMIVKFRTEEFWKGKLSKEVTVFTGLGGGDCGYKFEIGQRYLVYAYESDNANFGTNICQRTASFSEAAADLKVLGKGKSRDGRSPKTIKSAAFYD
jgi:hypothetical protein